MTFGTEWTPDKHVRSLIERADLSVHGIELIMLYDITTFRLNKKFWKLGISLTRSKIVFNPRITDYPLEYQAKKICHELTHGAQRSFYGAKFIFMYIGQWIKAGCDYNEMKTFGLERRAIEVEQAFEQSRRGM